MPDYREAFDRATRAWARERLARNAQQGVFEASPIVVLSSINTLRDAYGLDLLRPNTSHDGLAGEPGSMKD